MNSLYAVLLKNALLLALVIVSLVFIFTSYIGYKEVYYVFGTLGLLYVIASCFEAYKLSQLQIVTERFEYFTDGFFVKRIIKIIVLLASAVLLFLSNSIIKYMAFLFAIIAITEIIVTGWRYFKKLCYVAFTDNQLIIATNKIQTIAISNIQKIETRHGLTYFVDKQNNALTIQSYMMKDKEGFSVALKQWLTKHQLINKLIEQE